MTMHLDGKFAFRRDYVQGTPSTHSNYKPTEATAVEKKVSKQGKPLLVIFSGAPGSGKSTWATRAFSFIKSNYRDVKVEYLPEPIKILAYKPELTIADQDRHNLQLVEYLNILGDSALDVVLTDVDPRHCWLAYKAEHFKDRLIAAMDKFNVVTLMVERHPEYQAFGRTQSADIASALHIHLLKELEGLYSNIPNSSMLSDEGVRNVLMSHNIIPKRGERRYD